MGDWDFSIYRDLSVVSILLLTISILYLIIKKSSVRNIIKVLFLIILCYGLYLIVMDLIKANNRDKQRERRLEKVAFADKYIPNPNAGVSPNLSSSYTPYHDAELNRKRSEFVTNNTGYDYDMVINHEIGGLLTDHILVTLLTEKNSVSTILKNLDFIKLWGCNTGVENWVYSEIYVKN